MSKPKIITLCGSTRFQKDYEETQKDLTLKGNIVISVGLFGHQIGLDMDSETKKMLDELHFRKIDISDEIFVVNPVVIVCGRCEKPCRLFTELSQETECCRTKTWQKRSYIGSSTRNEINYAIKNNKKVNYLTEEE